MVKFSSGHVLPLLRSRLADYQLWRWGPGRLYLHLEVIIIRWIKRLEREGIIKAAECPGPSCYLLWVGHNVGNAHVPTGRKKSVGVWLSALKALKPSLQPKRILGERNSTVGGSTLQLIQCYELGTFLPVSGRG